MRYFYKTMSKSEEEKHFDTRVEPFCVAKSPTTIRIGASRDDDSSASRGEF
jgi:hypothetical protein